MTKIKPDTITKPTQKTARGHTKTIVSKYTLLASVVGEGSELAWLLNSSRLSLSFRGGIITVDDLSLLFSTPI